MKAGPGHLGKSLFIIFSLIVTIEKYLVEKIEKKIVSKNILPFS